MMDQMHHDYDDDLMHHDCDDDQIDYIPLKGDLTLAVSLTTPNEYPWNCQLPVAHWLPRGGVR